MRGADILASTLEDVGVEYTFGLAGSAILGCLDSIAQSDVEFVTTRHEQVATTAASAYALATRRPAATIAHVGPGAANQVLGTAAAYRDNIPMLTISGNEPSHRLGRDVRHEWDVEDVFEEFTKYNVSIDQHDPAYQLRDAVLRTVSGVPGPVHIDFPRDLEETEFEGPNEQAREKLRARDNEASISRSAPTSESIEETVNLLRNADRPLVIVGTEARWFEPEEPLRRLAETAGLPIATTDGMRGALPESHPMSLGKVGRGGMDPTNDYLRRADLVLGVGSRFSDTTTLNWELIDPDDTLVHATISQRDIDRQYVADVNCLADPGSFLRALADALTDTGLSFEDTATAVHADCEAAREEFLDPTIEPAREGVDPRKLVVEIDERADEYTFTTGGGVHGHFVRPLHVEDLDGYFVTQDFAGMSQGLGLAMGAQLALDRPVFCFEGDGGFAMVMQEMETLVREEIPVKIVVLNNDSYMSQRARQKKYYGERYTGSTFSNPDFGAVAEEFGMHGERIEEDEQIPGAVERFVSESGPALLEAAIDPWLDTGDYDRD